MFKAKDITDMTIDEMASHMLEVITFMHNYANLSTSTELIEQTLIDAGYCIDQMWQRIGELESENEKLIKAAFKKSQEEKYGHKNHD